MMIEGYYLNSMYEITELIYEYNESIGEKN
jgi:hypothetical protein